MAVSKPLAGTRIDPASVWANGNANFWPFNEGAGAGSIDATGRSNGLNTAVTRIGQYLSFNGSTSVIVCGKAKYDVQQTTKFSGIAQVITTSASRPLLIGNWQVGSSGGWAFRIDTGGGIELIVSNSNGSNYFKATATSSVLDGKPHVIGFDYRGTSSNSGIDLFVDGVKQAVTPSTFGTGNPGTLTDSGVRIGLRNDGYDQYSGKLGFVGVLFGQVLGVSGHQAIAANPWALWPDEPQLVFAPVTTFTGTATTSQAQTAAATGLAGNIGTATSSQAQTAAASGLSGYIGTATASQAQTANATGLAGVIGTATSSQAQSATGAGAETYNGNATSSQAQTAAAVGLAGVIGTATASQAQTSDAIGVAGIVGTATSSQAQTVNGTGNNGQLSVQFGGHIAQPQYIHVPMFARGTGKATCKSRPHVRVLTRALAIGRSKGTCRPLARQFMAGRAVGASVPVISSMRLQYNETWHAQRARDDQSLLFGF